MIEEHNSEGKLWQLLTFQQQQEILIAYEESEDELNLISLTDIKSKYSQWPLPKLI